MLQKIRSSTPIQSHLMRKVGSNHTLDRKEYARLGPNGDVVTVAAFEVRRLTELLKAVGALPPDAAAPK